MLFFKGSNIRSPYEPEARLEVRCRGTLVRFVMTKSGPKRHVLVPGTTQALCGRTKGLLIGPWSAEEGAICVRCERRVEALEAAGWLIQPADESVKRDNAELRAAVSTLDDAIKGEPRRPILIPQEIPPLEIL